MSGSADAGQNEKENQSKITKIKFKESMKSNKGEKGRDTTAPRLLGVGFVAKGLEEFAVRGLSDRRVVELHPFSGIERLLVIINRK